MQLDYHYTCRDIDNNIEAFKEELRESITEIADELLPSSISVNEISKETFIKSWVNHILKNCSNIFEDVRSTNDDMRKQADRQLSDLAESKEEVEDELAEAQYKNQELETKVEELEEIITELKQQEN